MSEWILPGVQHGRTLGPRHHTTLQCKGVADLLHGRKRHRSVRAQAVDVVDL